MSHWQWLCNGSWFDFDSENDSKLNARFVEPSMGAMELNTEWGTLNGCPEGWMRFRFHGDDEATKSCVRRTPKGPEPSLIQIHDGPIKLILPPPASAKLFAGDVISTEEVVVDVGTEKFRALNGRMFKFEEGVWVPQNYSKISMNSVEYGDTFSTRYSWEFKGPMRWERMCAAVEHLLGSSKAEEVEKLENAFESFECDDSEATDYGPWQFNDYLVSLGHTSLAFKLMEKYYEMECSWHCFDPMTNWRIEKARSEGRPMAMIRAGGHSYMLLFDNGTGASGGSPVVIRPSRYQKILESIEEQFESQIDSNRRQHLSRLFDILVQNDVAPRQFLLGSIMDPANVGLSVPEHVRPQVGAILSQMEDSGRNLSTRIQEFMPALLEKFKECEVRLSTKENIKPKELSPDIKETLSTGMKVPCGWETDFRGMFRFIEQHQTWKFNSPKSTCDICGDKSCGLSHCGNARACLKCWSSTLIRSNFSCPFCRGQVESGSLRLAKRATSNRKRKRQETSCSSSSMTVDDILATVRKDKLYKDISKDTSFAMRKWFVILLRRGLINVHQRPKNDQAAKKFSDALKIFKLV